MVRRLCLALMVLAFAAGCAHEEPHSIVVQADKISVFNLTDVAWSGVEVWLNDHYRAQAPRLAPGGRLDAPIRVFAAAYGQQFDPKRQVPFGVEVTAKGDDGRPVRLIWGKGRRR